MFFGPDIEPPTEKAKTYKSRIYIFLIVYVFITIFKMAYTQGGFQDLISALFLYCGARSINFCYLSFFILMTFFSFFTCIVIIGTAIQQNKTMFNRKNAMAYTVIILAFLVYIYGYYLCFLAYREFKAIAFSKSGTSGGGLAGLGAPLMGGNTQQAAGAGGNTAIRGQMARGNNAPREQENTGGFRAFGGQGVTIG